MIKTVIKEIIIFLLLLVSIALLLAILFYDYIPTTRIVPTKLPAYVLPKEVQEELDALLEQAAGPGYVYTTHTVDSSDLKAYENTRQYDKGKINPFEKYVPAPPVAPPEQGGTGNTNNTGSGNTGGSNNNSVGNFYESK